MKTSKKSWKNVVSACLVLGSLASCGKGKSDNDDEGEKTALQKAEEQLASGHVTMVGSLNLLGATGLNLAEKAYDLYCVTFMEEPASCKVEIDTEGAFNKECVDFAGTSFGCFLRQNGDTITTLEFSSGSEKDTSIIAGSGDLKFEINFDESTGSAYAAVDETSSALSPEALGKIKEALNEFKTTVPNLTGNWNIEFDCAAENAPKDGPCGSKLAEDEGGFSIYINHKAIGKQDYASLWQSKEAFDRCIGDSGEGQPNFKVGENVFKFATRAEYDASTTAIFSSLSAALQTKLLEEAKVKQKANWGWCEEQQNQFSDESCKFALEAVKVINDIDPNGNPITREERQGFNFEKFTDIVEYTGAVKEETVDCWKDDAGKVQCPWGVREGETKYKRFISDKGYPVKLVCYDSSTKWQFMDDARASTKDASITAMTSGGQQKPEECDAIATGPFKGLNKASKQEIDQTITELFSSLAEEEGDNGGDNGRCSHRNIPDAFTFAKCATYEGNEKPSICYEYTHFSQQLGLKVGTDGKLAVDGESNNFQYPWDFGQFGCPTAHAKTQGDGQFDGQAIAVECRVEYAAKSLDEQIKAIRSISERWVPMAEKIICGGDEYKDIKDSFKALVATSCMPDIRLDHTCDEEGKCVRQLRCSGSSAEGKCYDDNGNFAGRIAGRHTLMRVKPRIAGAFELQDISVDKWQRWDDENKKQIACRYVNKTIIQAVLGDDNGSSWSGNFNQASKEECDSDSSSGDSRDGKESGGNDGRLQSIPVNATKS